jgi:hypothetical protein
MQNLNIRSKCSVNTNRETDTFVGIKCDDGDISINFPLCFEVSDNNEGLKKDILLLLSILAKNTEHRKSEILGESHKFDEVTFPIQAFIAIISDFYDRGYYKEQEVEYTVAKKGKINWNRTIKTQRPYVQGTDVFYLDFVTKKHTVNETELITLIHEYCVYDSFEKIGWLFSKGMPQKPRMKGNPKLFVATIKAKLATTFNDKNKALFRNMLSILNYAGDEGAKKNYKYGTYRFEYIWESMIDKVFGIKNKNDYFPKTTWIINGNQYDNPSLEPDTIMIHNDNIYVLDAKYYKYGLTKSPSDLPKSSSINKQITYGEYIAEGEKFKDIHGHDINVYNAFLMPFNTCNSPDSSDIKITYVGEGTSSWKDNKKDYQRVQGILIDVKYLMNINMQQDEQEISKLATFIDATNKSRT